MSGTADHTAKALEMKDALLDAYDPEAIILFGSLARGDGDEFSDVDLLVVMDTERDAKSLSEEMSRYLDSLARDKHVIVRTPREFCRQGDIPGTLAFSAEKEGRVLFEKPGWRSRHKPADGYSARKQEVIHQGYIKEAEDFLCQAGLSLEGGHFFRCRDFARFAGARALKGLFVKHDMQPPRETDLVELLEKAGTLEPDLAVHASFLRELNEYCPVGRDALEISRGRSMVQRTTTFVKEIADKCSTAP
jgi:predicted nucleotidyltransferase/HEPN domain-containing protein